MCNQFSNLGIITIHSTKLFFGSNILYDPLQFLIKRLLRILNKKGFTSVKLETELSLKLWQSQRQTKEGQTIRSTKDKQLWKANRKRILYYFFNVNETKRKRSATKSAQFNSCINFKSVKESVYILFSWGVILSKVRLSSLCFILNIIRVQNWLKIF